MEYTGGKRRAHINGLYFESPLCWRHIAALREEWWSQYLLGVRPSSVNGQCYRLLETKESGLHAPENASTCLALPSSHTEVAATACGHIHSGPFKAKLKHRYISFAYEAPKLYVATVYCPQVVPSPHITLSQHSPDVCGVNSACGLLSVYVEEAAETPW